MKKYLVAAAFVLFAAPAFAADKPVKKPIYTKAPPAPIYSWTGFYVGGNFGVSAGADRFDQLTSTFLGLAFTFAHNATAHSPFGAIGGLQAGYNWQSSNFVIGLEGDIQASGQKDAESCLSICVVAGQGAGVGDRISQRLPWFATARGRIGYAAGPVLFYATAGAAFTELKTSYTTNFFSTFSGDARNEKTGSAVGGGIEAGLAGNWTAKIEYLYLHFAHVTDTFAFGAGTPVVATIGGNIRDHIARIGLNYRFGGFETPAYGVRPVMPTKAPIIAPPVYSWAGFYIGGNVGYGVSQDAVSELIIGNLGTDNDRMTLVTRGWLGGGQAGINWQFGYWVAGVEADYQFSDQKDAALFNNFNPGFSTVDQKLSWFATGRGRIGYAVGPALFYATSGVAFTDVKTNAAIVNVHTGNNGGSFSNSRTGWVAGAGVEGVLKGNWTAKLEYLYMDFDSFTNLFPGAPALGNLADPNVHLTSRVRDNIFRLGLNYHFGWSGPTITASY
jgi:outer membrane immunogenic protein